MAVAFPQLPTTDASVSGAELKLNWGGGQKLFTHHPT